MSHTTVSRCISVLKKRGLVRRTNGTWRPEVPR